MGDSYRPGRSDRHRDRDRDCYPPLSDRMNFTNDGGHSYWPAESQRRHETLVQSSEFTFRASHPAPQFLSTAPPTGPANTGLRHHGSTSQRNPRRNNVPESTYYRNRNRIHGPPRGRPRKAAPYERALLQQRNDRSPEHTMGVPDGSNRFLNVEDISNDEEDDTEAESDRSIGDNTVKQKRIRAHMITRVDSDLIPKWSNPDPYTVLPPVDETTGKKTDFVKLIRKAKNQSVEKATGDNAVAANDDFISFSDDKDPAKTTSEDGVPESSLYDQHSKQERDFEHDNSISSARRELVQNSMNEMPKTESSIPGIHDRKQTSDTWRSDNHPQTLTTDKKRKHGFDSAVVDCWRSQPNSDCTPWLRSLEPYVHLADDPMKWLHNEILDFCDFVAPKSFEHDLRKDLVRRVNDALGPRVFPNDYGRIYSFGSFPAGLYLPTADMDLVYTSDHHYNGGGPALDFSAKGASKKILYRVARTLTDRDVSTSMPTVIAMARVPLVKFVDKLTRLQVDISFENMSGVQAQATFAAWKRQYPDMEYMVVLLKQFLVMRGLNEVHTGGIGGFSIICLIVNYLHHHNNTPHLGACLMGFLDYYGNQFDLSRKRLQMNPPAVKDKTNWGIDNRPEKVDGLSIQDPNRPENNITGGSYRAKDAFKAFALAHRTLEDRISAADFSRGLGSSSILGCILGANYESYRVQRRYLESVK